MNSPNQHPTPWTPDNRPLLLTQRIEAIERMLAAVPEDAESVVDGRTRAALTGYVQGVRDALEYREEQ
ncbi:hypothetical protein [Arthrobacter sp. BF1]|uniref:hypothetical protein n=1 Tax=Arthrobacter sp. BF1 TaxID=2821145 RepID=UPI001C4FB7E2|nr:hypothetical protein [Arthrobacter sp. BF1]